MKPPAISVTIDKTKMRAIEHAVAETPKALPRIMYRALKRTAAGGRTQLDREIRTDLTVKKAAVMKRITDEEKATSARWVWRLGISRKRLALSSFRYRTSKRRGVSYFIRKGQQRRVPSGFERDMPRTDSGSYQALFRRAGADGQQVPRYPLVFLRGPSLGQAVTDAPGMLRKVEQAGSQRLEKEVFGQINLLLQRRWPK